MWNRARVWLQNVTGSMWLVPAGLIVGAVVLAVAMVELSGTIDREVLLEYPRIFGAGADSSREMLTTIAGAMMTVAGVTFSITILAVAQASSQYTPRILRNFMRDRTSQVTLGTLTGVFVYCLVVVRTVRGDQDVRFIPALAILMAFALAILAIGVLVYFIHHIAESLQASSILARVRNDTIAAIDRLFPDEVGEEAATDPAADMARDWRPIPARRTGYMTHVDADGLLDYAARHDAVVRMEHGIGDHVIAGTPLVSIAGGGPDRDGEEAALNGIFALATFRTVDQDAAFGIRQMVDMAIKALSPGVNDSSTAIASVDSIGAVLVRLANRRIEDRHRVRDGQLRVIARGPTFVSLADLALNEIRRNADGNVSILARLLATIEVVVGCTCGEERRQLLLAHADRILATSERSVPDAEDRAEVRAVHERVRRAVMRARIASLQPTPTPTPAPARRRGA